MSKVIGVICEDKSDLEVLDEIFQKYMKYSEYKLKKFIGYGCGKIESKCDSWVQDLIGQGCNYIIVVRDLDDENELELNQRLTKKIDSKASEPWVLVVPVREMEAWLLTGATVLKNVFKLSKIPKIHSNPETYPDPKKVIADIVRKYRINKNVSYSNATHNPLIAQKLSLAQIRKCKSYKVLDKFIVDTITK